jgi:hypothetical protein
MTQGWFLFATVGMFWSHSLYSELFHSLLYTKYQLNNLTILYSEGNAARWLHWVVSRPIMLPVCQNVVVGWETGLDDSRLLCLYTVQCAVFVPTLRSSTAYTFRVTEFVQVHTRVPNRSLYILGQHKEATACTNSASLKTEAVCSSETSNRKHALQCRNEEDDHQCNLYSMHSYSSTAIRRIIHSFIRSFNIPSFIHLFIHSFSCYVNPGESSLVTKMWSWTILDPISARHKK